MAEKIIERICETIMPDPGWHKKEQQILHLPMGSSTLGFSVPYPSNGRAFSHLQMSMSCKLPSNVPFQYFPHTYVIFLKSTSAEAVYQCLLGHLEGQVPIGSGRGVGAEDWWLSPKVFQRLLSPPAPPLINVISASPLRASLFLFPPWCTALLSCGCCCW